MMGPAPRAERIRAALDEVLAWPELARSPQLVRFLRYIVEASLDGDEAAIKAYAIAVDVFGRPASFDPQSDPIVRVQARRLRQLLDRFYDEGHGATGVRIVLPVGRYVPDFIELAAPAPEAVRPGTMRRDAGIRRVLLVAAITLLMASMAAIGALPAGERVTAPTRPEVLVGNFSNLSEVAAADGFTGRLAVAIAEALAPFGDIEVRLLDQNAPLPPPREGRYLLSGVLRSSEAGLEVVTLLAAGPVGETRWNLHRPLTRPALDDERSAPALAAEVVRQLAPYRGPLHATGRQWLNAQEGALPLVNDYICMLAYGRAREALQSAAMAEALACYQRLLGDRVGTPRARAAQAGLQALVTVANSLPDQLPDALQDVLERLDLVARQAPDDSFVRAQLGLVQGWTRRFTAAVGSFRAALLANPLDPDIRAGYALLLVHMGAWDEADAEAARVLAEAVYPAPWHALPQALVSFQARRYPQAIEAGRLAAPAGEMGMLVAVAAAGLSDARADVEDLLARIASAETLRRLGIRPWLEMRLVDEEVVERLGEGLVRAGVAPAALTAPY